MEDIPQEYKRETYNTESGFESKTVSPKEVDYVLYDKSSSEDEPRRRKKSLLAFSGEVLVYILLLPIITSYYFIYFRANRTRDFFIDDVPRSVKIVAWSLWILMGLLYGYYRIITDQSYF